MSSNKSSTEDLDEVTCLEGKSNNRATPRMLKTLMMIDDDDIHDDDGDGDKQPAKKCTTSETLTTDKDPTTHVEQ